MTENSQKIDNGSTESHRWKIAARISLILITSAVLVLCFPWEKTTEYAHLSVGSVVTEEIIAPFDFEVLKSPSELEQERLVARQSVNPVFNRVDSISLYGLQRFDDLWAKIHELSTTLYRDTMPLSMMGTILRDSLKVGPPLSLELPGWQFLDETARDPQRSRRFVQPLRQIIDIIYTSGILDVSLSEIESPDGRISLLEQGEESLVKTDNFYTLGSAKTDVVERLKTLFSADTIRTLDSLKVAYKLIVPFLKPNIIYDAIEMDARREKAVSLVPTVKGLVLKNERVVDSNVRLTQEHLDKLRSLDIKKAELVRVRGGFQFLAPIIGRTLLVLGLLVLMVAILHYLGQNLYRDFRRFLILSVILVLPVVSATLLVHQANLSIIYLPIAAAAIIASLLFDMTVAVGYTIVVSILSAAVAGYDFSAFIICLFPSLVAVIAVQGVQTRGRIMRAAIPIAVTFLLTITILHLLKYPFGSEAWREMGISLANAVASPILALGLLIPLELLSGITTDLTLLELSDLNRPLLRKLALEAPGTYHHSIVVGNLAEAAAEAIGANPLLVRVGAYYHDIGKIGKKEYFIENQENGNNVHDLLSPEMSASVLRDHITHGLALAKKYRIPNVVSDFIPQHHGTTMMVYFYHKALKQGNNKKIDPKLFRYPGPNPLTREAAILMLADVVEATSRSLKNPDVDDVRGAVDQSVETRINMGELDESDLTLTDIKKIKDAFVHVLSGAIHQRIEYPSGNDVKQAQAEESQDTSVT